MWIFWHTIWYIINDHHEFNSYETNEWMKQRVCKDYTTYGCNILLKKTFKHIIHILEVDEIRD